MGLSFHYSGKIKNVQSIPELTREFEDICTSLHWENTTIQNDEVDGIVFSPENCEPLFFTFTKDGELISPILLQYEIEPATTISVKIQYAGIDTHIAVIKLLRYISQKYFSDFTVMDEGNYWETDNEQILRQQFNKYEMLLDFMVATLQSLPAKENESAASLADRIERLLNEKFKNQ